MPDENPYAGGSYTRRPDGSLERVPTPAPAAPPPAHEPAPQFEETP